MIENNGEYECGGANGQSDLAAFHRWVDCGRTVSNRLGTRRGRLLVVVGTDQSISALVARRDPL
jgi:hypothetical protein